MRDEDDCEEWNPLASSNGSCPFKHDLIDTLYGVPPMPIEQLPRECMCGRAFTYADEVQFVTFTKVDIPPEFVSVKFDLNMTTVVHVVEYETVELNLDMVVCPDEVCGKFQET